MSEGLHFFDYDKFLSIDFICILLRTVCIFQVWNERLDFSTTLLIVWYYFVTIFSSESSDESSDGEESLEEDSTCAPLISFNSCQGGSIPIDPNAQSVEEVDSASHLSQATMWLGTEDGCIHIYHCGENIRLKKNRIRIQHGATVLCIVSAFTLTFKN